MADTWNFLAASNTSDGLKTAVPTVDDIPAGTEVRVTVEGLPFLTAKIFDLAGAEQTIGNLLVPAHAQIVDCYELNDVGYVDFVVTGSPVLPILIAVAVGLLAIGVISAIITVWVKGPEAIKPITDTISSMVMLVVIVLMMSVMTPLMNTMSSAGGSVGSRAHKAGRVSGKVAEKIGTVAGKVTRRVTEYF